MNAALLRVMYAPVDYIHPAYLPRPELPLSPALQSVLNHILIQRFTLKTELESSYSDFVLKLVSAWQLLPRVAWLIGCKMARGSLAMNGQMVRLAPVARQFIALPVACPVLPLPRSCTEEQLTIHGAVALLAQPWPLALRQRARLLFAPETPAELPDQLIQRSLIQFALDYAQNPSY